MKASFYFKGDAINNLVCGNITKVSGISHEKPTTVYSRLRSAIWPLQIRNKLGAKNFFKGVSSKLVMTLSKCTTWLCKTTLG